MINFSTMKYNLESQTINPRYGKSLTERKNNKHQDNDENKTFKTQCSQENDEISIEELEKDPGVQVIKVLLENKFKLYGKENKAKINQKDKYQLTPLHHAALR